MAGYRKFVLTTWVLVGLGISQHANLADQVVTTKLGLKQRPLPRPEQSQQKRPGPAFEFLAVERPVVIVVGGSEELLDQCQILVLVEDTIFVSICPLELPNCDRGAKLLRSRLPS